MEMKALLISATEIRPSLAYSLGVGRSLPKNFGPHSTRTVQVTTTLAECLNPISPMIFPFSIPRKLTCAFNQFRV